MTTFADLRVGDTILCPQDGIAERVVECRVTLGGRVAVVASRRAGSSHSHYREATAEVEAWR